MSQQKKNRGPPGSAAFIKRSVWKNHTYAVSSGRTWATLAQKNPKALALDPTPSAPGEEPVVTGVRIVNLDPKAKKAGGLAVALKGTPVIRVHCDADGGHRWCRQLEGEGELKVQPLENVKKGQRVTVKYDGTRKVKSVKVSKLD